MRIRKLADIEREAILIALYRFRGNRTQTAKALGVSLRTIRNKIDQYRIEGAWVIPCPCQYGYRAMGPIPCPNHAVDLTPHPEEARV